MANSRVRKGDGPQNFSILRHPALNVLNRETTAKLGLKGKRLKAGGDNDYLLRVVAAA